MRLLHCEYGNSNKAPIWVSRNLIANSFSKLFSLRPGGLIGLSCLFVCWSVFNIVKFEKKNREVFKSQLCFDSDIITETIDFGYKGIFIGQLIMLIRLSIKIFGSTQVCQYLK